MARASAARLPLRSSLASDLMAGTLGGVMAWCTPPARRRRGAAAAAHGFQPQPNRAGPLLLLRIALRARAAEDALAFRCQIRLQRLPGHEGDVRTFSVW